MSYPFSSHFFHKSLSKPPSSLSSTMPGKPYTCEPALVSGRALKQCRDERQADPGLVFCAGSSSKHPCILEDAGRTHPEIPQVSATPVVLLGLLEAEAPEHHISTSIGALEDQPPADLLPDQAHSPGGQQLDILLGFGIFL